MRNSFSPMDFARETHSRHGKSKLCLRWSPVAKWARCGLVDVPRLVKVTVNCRIHLLCRSKYGLQWLVDTNMQLCPIKGLMGFQTYHMYLDVFVILALVYCMLLISLAKMYERMLWHMDCNHLCNQQRFILSSSASI